MGVILDGLLVPSNRCYTQIPNVDSTREARTSHDSNVRRIWGCDSSVHILTVMITNLRTIITIRKYNFVRVTVRVFPLTVCPRIPMFHMVSNCIATRVSTILQLRARTLCTPPRLPSARKLGASKPKGWAEAVLMIYDRCGNLRKIASSNIIFHSTDWYPRIYNRLPNC